MRSIVVGEGFRERRDALSAWRVWNVAETEFGLRLSSVTVDVIWAPGSHVVAECLAWLPWAPKTWLGRPPHPAPSGGCRCGVSGTTPLRAATKFLDPSWTPKPPLRPVIHRVVGMVALWGNWISDGDEIRSSSAYPSSICVPTIDTTGTPVATTEIMRELERYGCALETVDPDDETNEVAAAVRGFRADLPEVGLWNAQARATLF